MENRKNLCAMIPEALHTQARTEQEQMNLTLSQYVEMVLKEHFENGGKKMANGTTRTLAFQISEELFGRIKAHLKATGLSQKDFVIGLIEQALKDAEAKAPQGEGRRRMRRGSLRNRRRARGKETDAGDAASATGRGGFSVTRAEHRTDARRKQAAGGKLCRSRILFKNL